MRLDAPNTGLKNAIVFAALIGAYFVIGWHGIEANSLTADEPAYIGAAYAYTKGVGVNPEHPLLLKLLNAAVVRTLFPDIQPVIPDLRSFDDRGGIRIAAYHVGYDFLMARAESFFPIVGASRFVYLAFNSLLLFWLAAYCLWFKLIDPRWGVTLAVLFVFSPPFYSHASLVSFDVPVAICAFMSVLSLVLVVRHAADWSGRQLITHFVILSILLGFALNTKYSNLLLVPIFAVAYGLTALYLFRFADRRRTYLFTALAAASLLVQPWGIWQMFGIGFAQSTGSFSDAVHHYWNGIRMTASAVRTATEPFLFGRYQPIDYLQYVQRIFWFKENPGIFLLALVTVGYAAVALFKRRACWDEYLGAEGKRFHGFVALLVLASYPVLYTAIAKTSRFVIGYRYFYPVVLFVYFFLAVLSTRVKRPVLAACLLLYALLGTLAMSQSVSYVNFFWPREKWLLTDDSTVNWGQETRHAVQYLLDQRLLPYRNSGMLAHNTYNVFINIPEYLSVLSRKQNYPIDVESYRKSDPVEPGSTDIALRREKYLIVDSSVIQRVSRDAATDPAAARNLQFLRTQTPIYSRNGIVFIYQLH